MRIIIILLFISSFIIHPNSIFGQSSFPDSVNNIVNGLKEGYWQTFKKFYVIIRKYDITCSVQITEDSIEYNSVKPDKNTDLDQIYCLNKEGFFINGKKNGIWKYYNCSKDFNYNPRNNNKDTIKGKLLYQLIFTEDSINGILTSFFPTGKIKSEVTFINNTPIGKIQCYFEDGKTYISGEIKKNEKFFFGDEYSPKGYKLQSRYFLIEDILKEWTNINEIKQLIISP